MITMSQTKSANYLFIVVVLKSMRNSGVITAAEYERAKRYYQKLTGSDLVIADSDVRTASSNLMEFARRSLLTM